MTTESYKYPLFNLEKLKQELDEVFDDTRLVGWNGYNARPPLSSNFDLAFEFAKLLPLGIVMPVVKPHPMGNLSLSWFEKPNMLISTVFSKVGIVCAGSMKGVEISLNSSSDDMKSMVQHVTPHLEIFTNQLIKEKQL